MMLSITRLETETPPEDLAERFQQGVLPELRSRGSASGAFRDDKSGETIVVEWAEGPGRSEATVLELLGDFGFDLDRRLYTPLSVAAFIGLPTPSEARICDLQYNGHEFRGRAIRCDGGHSFDASHHFEKCTIDGRPLR
jgi:hypothetical protein